MNLKNILQEMARELLPNVSSEDDLKIISQLKKLYKKDTEEFTRKLKRINIVRKSEKLEPIHKNEIIKGYTKTIVKQKIKKGKEGIEKETAYIGLSFNRKKLVKKDAFYFIDGVFLYYEDKEVGKIVASKDKEIKFFVKKNAPESKMVKKTRFKKDTIIFPEIGQKVTIEPFNEYNYSVKIKEM